ncbi:MAG: tetratricopeptide repeat protein [Rivularia sp. (in: cyanobacteria)]
MNNNEENQNHYFNGDNINQKGNLGVGVNKGTINNINNPLPEKPVKPIKYIPKVGNKNFVGREDELIKIHDKFSETNNTVAISSVSGMGGVGKTELAIQYAQTYSDNYSGGICWLNVRDSDLANEIIQFIKLQMGLEVPQKDKQENPLTVDEQVAWCWRNWLPPEGLVLVILDDVTEYKDIKKLLPRTDNQRFKLLITTRQRRLDTNLVDIPLDVLSENEALSLLRGILGEDDSRIDRELETAKDLCKWLGYLPLGLELVGRYLEKDPDLSIAEMLEELEEERLNNEAINPDSEDLENTEMTARLGVQAAFNLTWEKLDSKTQEVGELLSLFNPNDIAWEYVESVSESLKKFSFKKIIKFWKWNSLNWTNKDVLNAKKELYGRNVIKRLEKEEEKASYQIHPLIREFLQVKLQASPVKNELKQAFTSTFIEIAQTIPDSPTLDFINSVKNAIPHLTEVAENHLDVVSDDNLVWPFIGNGRFYEGQSYTLAQPWFEQCLLTVRSRLGENHPDTASSLNNLASLYKSQGKYEQAEPLYIQALELRKQLLGENHPHTASSLNNLASLYDSQGKYEEAEPLYIQALELRKQLLGENHPHTATSLNNLALLYKSQGKYEEAEPLYIQALQLRKQLLGENHPDTATSLNDLALLYENQGRYSEAEPLYIQALQLRKQLQGVNHPDTATSLNDLAYLYQSQGKYDEAEPLYIQAVEIAERVLGANHPNTVIIRNNFQRFRGKQESVSS